MSTTRPRPLVGQSALVTGASRGIGRGVAIALGAAGAHVFITGRSEKALVETAKLVRDAASAERLETGTSDDACSMFICDHADDDAVTQCFADMADVLQERGSSLDILVNNAFAGAPAIADNIERPFWAKGDEEGSPGEYWDAINNVGLRSNYVATVLATRLMLPKRSGLIVNISSFGGLISIFDAAYSCGKDANDRLIAELGRELRDTGVQAITLYPGLVATEFMKDGPLKPRDGRSGNPANQLAASAWNAESPVYVGRVIAAIAADKNQRTARRRQGQIVVAAEAGNRYGVRDLGGEPRFSPRSIRTVLYTAIPALRNSPLKHLVPDFLVPWSLVALLAGGGPSVAS